MAKDKKYMDEHTRKEEEDRYQKGKSFEEKTAEVFKLMGCEVELNRRIAGNEIDILIKKKSFAKRYDYYICECKDWDRKAGNEIVNKYVGVWAAVKQNLKQQDTVIDCRAMIISPKGFTEDARETAQGSGIILTTYDELLSELMNFDKYLTDLILKFESPAPNEPKLKDLYIEPDFFPERDPNEMNSFQFVEQWLKKPERKQFSLLGDYGTGKTCFAKKLAYQMAKEYKKKPGSGRIPFLVDLRQCQKALSLHTLLLEQLKNAGIEPVNADIFLKLSAEGKILLIFDAFDEMATMSSAEITLNNFRQLNQAVNGEAKVILTSRTHYFRDKFEVDKILKKQGVEGLSPYATMLLREVYDKPEYEIVYLKEFTPDQVKQYLEKALKDKWQEAYNKIQSIYNLEDLSTRPVLLDMIVKTLPKIDEKRLQEFSVVHLYELFTYSWIERDDYRLQITRQGKEELVEALASKLWQEGEKSIHYTALSGILSIHLKSKIKTTRELEQADYEVRTASFLVRDDEGNYGFAHKSFQEFFIARKIKKELEKKKYNVLDLRRLSMEIMFFLRHLIDEDEKIIQPMARLLSKAYQKNISENALLLFYMVIKMSCLHQRFSMQEDVEFTGKEAEAFQQCLIQKLPGKIDLKTAVLNGTALSWLVLSKTDLSEAGLENALLTHSTFEEVSFQQANLKYSDSSYSVFKNVTFERTDAQYGNFKNCIFKNCTFRQSNFRLANFQGVVFKGCVIEENDFTGTGFLGSKLDLQAYQKNTFFGTGQPGTLGLALKPLLNIGHGFGVTIVAISKDSRYIVSGGDDNMVRLWDLESGRLLHTLEGHEDSVLTVAISDDNRRLVSGSVDKTVKLWDLESGRLLNTLEGHKGYVWSVAISGDNDRRSLVSGSSDHTVRLWDLESGHLLLTMRGHEDTVKSVAISGDNRHLVSGSDDHTVRLWDLESGRLLLTLEGHEDAVRSVAISGDNRHLVSGSDDHTVRLWDLESGRLLLTLEGHEGHVRSVAISGDNRLLVSGSSDKTVRLWDLKSGRLLNILKGHENAVRSVAISTDNRRLVSGSDDKTVKLWDLESSLLLNTLEGHKDYVWSVAISRDNRHLVSGSSDKTVKLWDLESGLLINTLKGHKGYVSSVAVSRDNRRLVSASDDNTIKLWDLESGHLLNTFEGHKYWVRSVAISMDNRCLVSASDDNTIKLWDLESGCLLNTLEGHEDSVLSVAISGNNRYLVSGSEDKAVKLWDLESGSLLNTLKGHKKAVWAVAVSGDNRRLVSGSDDKTVKLWDLESKRLLYTLEGHKGYVRSVAISGDNLHLVSGSDDHTVRLWDLENGCLIKTLKGHHDYVFSVTFSPDNRWIISSGHDNTIRCWDSKTGELIYTIHLLPGNHAITLFKDNRFLASSDTALQYLYYTDGLARYPSRDLPELRFQKTSDQEAVREQHKTLKLDI
jgi:WD40 repeat protein